MNSTQTNWITLPCHFEMLLNYPMKQLGIIYPTEHFKLLGINEDSFIRLEGIDTNDYGLENGEPTYETLIEKIYTPVYFKQCAVKHISKAEWHHSLAFDSVKSLLTSYPNNCLEVSELNIDFEEYVCRDKDENLSVTYIALQLINTFDRSVPIIGE